MCPKKTVELLLNLSDGILNDILGFQIIATFNSSLDDIDKALLRSGRLISRKEFNPLSKKQTIELTNKLKLKNFNSKNGTTLSDIYSHKMETNILEHNVSDDNDKFII